MSERILVAAAGGLLLFGAAYAFRDDMPESLRRALFGKPVPPPRWRGPVAASPPLPAEPPIEVGASSHRVTPRARMRPIPVYDISVEIPPAPVASDIRPSMSMAEVVAKYGAPDATAVWSNSGSLNEKLIYGSGSTALDVDVRNGSVVGSRLRGP